MRHDPEIESRVRRFEQAWQLHDSRAIEAHLGEPFASGAPGRDLLLVELIGADLEFRWRNAGVAEPVSLQAYAGRFPELGPLDRLPIDLIGEAYLARHRWGDRPSQTAFLAPFRERRDALRQELARVDAEIAEEAEPGTASRSPTLPEPRIADEGPIVPRLSHRDYRLRRMIGAGGTGKVYEASPLVDGEGDVAVKFLRKSLLKHADVVGRFVGEARTVAGLRHPNIVRTLGLGRTESGSYFLVMELVAGPDLAKSAGGRAVSEEEAIGWAIAICDALDHAHGRGVVHCDLKPANILLDPRAGIKVTDFGLARSIAGDAARAGSIEGTAPFMAPEQASRAWGPIDRRTDVYGIGAVLFTLLTGRPPFVGRRVSDILADVIAPTPVIAAARLRPELSGPLGDICARCLSKAPEARFQGVGEVRAALVSAREGRASPTGYP